MSLKESITKYFELQKEIYNYFGYVENWVAIPLEDLTEDYWNISNDEYFHSPMKYSLSDFDNLENPVHKQMYGGIIYKQRFLKKWVYCGEEYTMIVADTQCDGNKFLYIFDNTKEIKE